MIIIAHDEDSMTNLFFSEVHRHGKLDSFLKLIEWRNHSQIPFNISNAEIHQQVNFSQFGKPDVAIIVTDQKEQKHIVIVEVKLGTYLESSISNENGRFNNKFNSRLNNQLTLRYRAMHSLSSLKRGNFITECEHIRESPYYEDKIRRCKKPSTINLFKDIASDPFQFYLVTLTSDNDSPFKDVDTKSKLFPLFFNNHSSAKEEFHNLGSVRWNKCRELFTGLDNHFSKAYSLHFDNQSKDEESEIRQGDLFVKGRQIIKYEGKQCHLSCRGYSYAIRYLEKGRFVENDRGKNDREKYLSLKKKIQILEKAPEEPIENISFWENYFLKREG